MLVSQLLCYTDLWNFLYIITVWQSGYAAYVTVSHLVHMQWMLKNGNFTNFEPCWMHDFSLWLQPGRGRANLCQHCSRYRFHTVHMGAVTQFITAQWICKHETLFIFAQFVNSFGDVGNYVQSSFSGVWVFVVEIWSWGLWVIWHTSLVTLSCIKQSLPFGSAGVWVSVWCI